MDASEYINKHFIGGQIPKGNFDYNKYRGYADTEGELFRVWNNDTEEYEDVSFGKFREDYNNPERKYVHHLSDKSYFLDQKGNKITAEPNEFYKYLHAGYTPLDTEIVRIMGAEDKDLKGEGVREFLPKNALGTGVSSFISRTAEFFSGGLDRTLTDALFGVDNYSKRTRRLEEEELKSRHATASRIGSASGAGVGLVGGVRTLGGLFKATGVTGLATKATKIPKIGSVLNTTGVKWGATGGAYSLPNGISNALAEKDIGKGAETIMWGAFSGGVLGTLGKGAINIVGAVGKGSGSFGRSVSDWGMKGYFSQTISGKGEKLVSKIQNNVLYTMKNGTNESLKNYNKNIEKILTPKQKKRIFGDKGITPQSLRDKSDEIWKEASQGQKFDITSQLTNLSGGYEKMGRVLSKQADDVQNLLTNSMNKIKKFQKTQISQNQEIKKTLRDSKFIDAIYTSNPKVLDKSIRKARDVSTAYFKKNINKFKDVEFGKRKDFLDFFNKFNYWTTQNKNALKSLNTSGYRNYKKDDLVNFLKSEKFDADEIQVITKYYDDVVAGNAKGMEIARDVNVLEMLANKSGKLTNAEVEAITKITHKYRTIKNPFNQKVFAGTKDEADNVAFSLLKSKDTYVTKPEMMKIIDNVYSNFSKASRAFGGKRMIKSKMDFQRMVSAQFGNKQQISVADLKNFQNALSDSKRMFSSSKDAPVIAKIFDDFYMKVSNMRGEKMLNVLKDDRFKGVLSKQERSLIGKWTRDRKLQSLNLQMKEAVEGASGFDLSAFLVKEPIVATLGILGYVSGGLSGAVLGGGVGVVASYAIAQTIKKGLGIVGTARLARNFAHGIDRASTNIAKFNSPKNFIAGITGSKSFDSGLAKTTIPNLNRLSEALFGEETNDPMTFQVMTQQALQMERLPEDSVISGAEEMINNTNANTPQLDTIMYMVRQNMLKALSESLGYINSNDPEKQEKLVKFSKDISVLTDPTALTKSIKDKSITPQMMRNFRNVFPSHYKNLKKSLILEHQAKDFNKTIEYDKLVLLGMLFEYDFTGLRGGYNVDTNYQGMQNVNQEFKRKVKTAEDHESQSSRIERF